MLRLTLDALWVLDVIDREGSFARAAAAIHRVPSAVTYAVRKLEQDLGITLFDRAGHRAELTAAGRELLESGRHLLRAAEDLQCRAQRIATGWEARLGLAVDHLIPATRLLPIIEKFLSMECGTRLGIQREVFGGTWDALVSGRADLAIGASGEGPPGGGYTSRPLGDVDMLFAVAPQHPLAHATEPLSETQLARHRAVAVADTSRRLAPRSAGLLPGQEVLTVPDMQAKLQAQRLGLGTGYLPQPIAEAEAAAGTLILKRVAGPALRAQLSVAWRTDHKGKALRWFLDHLQDGATVRSLLAP